MLTPVPLEEVVLGLGGMEGEGEDAATALAVWLSGRLALEEERGVWEGEGDMET